MNGGGGVGGWGGAAPDPVQEAVAAPQNLRIAPPSVCACVRQDACAHARTAHDTHAARARRHTLTHEDAYADARLDWMRACAGVCVHVRRRGVGVFVCEACSIQLPMGSAYAKPIPVCVRG